MIHATYIRSRKTLISIGYGWHLTPLYISVIYYFYICFLGIYRNNIGTCSDNDRKHMNIRTLCLGILQFEDATGYEINKLVADGRFSHFIEASYGSIYPALTKMMQEELVTCRTEDQEGKPSRKIYSITEQGRAELLTALMDTPKPNRFKSEFLFLGLFADLLPAHLVEKAVQHHEQQLTSLVADMREHIEVCTNPGSRFAIGYGIAANQATLDFIRENKHFLLNETPINEDPRGLEDKDKSYE